MRAAQLAARIVNIFNAHFEKTLDELSACLTRLGNKTNKINSSTLLQIVYFRTSSKRSSLQEVYIY